MIDCALKIIKGCVVLLRHLADVLVERIEQIADTVWIWASTLATDVACPGGDDREPHRMVPSGAWRRNTLGWSVTH